jgi:stringent starvation protein B
MAEISTRPYLIRAIYDWCTDSGYTPYLAVAVDDSVRVPREFVQNGEIVLNVSLLATSRLILGDEAIELHARFGGVARDIYVPVDRIMAIYAHENGQGMGFEVARETASNSANVQLDGSPPGPARRGPVPVESAPTGTSGDHTPEPPPAPAPAPGKRPKLTRVK